MDDAESLAVAFSWQVSGAVRQKEIYRQKGTSEKVAVQSASSSFFGFVVSAPRWNLLVGRFGVSWSPVRLFLFVAALWNLLVEVCRPAAELLLEASHAMGSVVTGLGCRPRLGDNRWYPHRGGHAPLPEALQTHRLH